MKITFRFFAQVRKAAGAESEAAEISDGADTSAALGELAAGHGEEFRSLVLDEAGKVRPSLVVLVNGTPAARGGGAKLSDGDQVSLLSAVAGG